MCLNVYDVAVDFLLLDAFDDLSSPPPGVLNITKSGWIPVAAKQGVSESYQCTKERYFLKQCETDLSVSALARGVDT